MAMVAAVCFCLDVRRVVVGFGGGITPETDKRGFVPGRPEAPRSISISIVIVSILYRTVASYITAIYHRGWYSTVLCSAVLQTRDARKGETRHLERINHM